MDGGRRRRLRSAAERDLDAKRAAWYAWWRSARFAAHFGASERPGHERYGRGATAARLGGRGTSPA